MWSAFPGSEQWRGAGRPREPVRGLTAAELPHRARKLGSIVATPVSGSGGYGMLPIVRARSGFSWHWTPCRAAGFRDLTIKRSVGRKATQGREELRDQPPADRGARSGAQFLSRLRRLGVAPGGD
ncbi:hypothetical protein GCM10010441_28940 [Kitasatospora paracochleata]